jgi:hypothetical protein
MDLVKFCYVFQTQNVRAVVWFRFVGVTIEVGMTC